jgi:hypothetical protein
MTLSAALFWRRRTSVGGSHWLAQRRRRMLCAPRDDPVYGTRKLGDAGAVDYASIYAQWEDRSKDLVWLTTAMRSAIKTWCT